MSLEVWAILSLKLDDLRQSKKLPADSIESDWYGRVAVSYICCVDEEMVNVISMLVNMFF